MKDHVNGSIDGEPEVPNAKIDAEYPLYDHADDLENHLADRTAQGTPQDDIDDVMREYTDSGSNKGGFEGALAGAELQKEELEYQLHEVNTNIENCESAREIATSERDAKLPFADRALNLGKGLMVVGALAVLPISVHSALINAEFEPIFEYPMYSVAFAGGPVLGILAIHGVRERLPNDLWQRRFDLLLHSGTILMAGHWVQQLSAMSGLGNTDLTGIAKYDAVTEATAEWLRASLALEILGAGSAFAGFMVGNHKGRKKHLEASPKLDDLKTERQRLLRALDDLTTEIGFIKGELSRLEASKRYAVLRARDRLRAMQADVSAGATRGAAQSRAELS